MKYINMTKLAKQYKLNQLEGHTYGQIKQEEIDKKHKEGYELYQIANNSNQHIKFEFRKA